MLQVQPPDISLPEQIEIQGTSSRAMRPEPEDLWLTCALRQTTDLHKDKRATLYGPRVA